MLLRLGADFPKPPERMRTRFPPSFPCDAVTLGVPLNPRAKKKERKTVIQVKETFQIFKKIEITREHHDPETFRSKQFHYLLMCDALRWRDCARDGLRSTEEALAAAKTSRLRPGLLMSSESVRWSMRTPRSAMSSTRCNGCCRNITDDVDDGDDDNP